MTATTDPRTHRHVASSAADTMLDRRAPFDLDAEMAVLGSIFLNPDSSDDVRQLLDAADFYDDAHRKIYELQQQMRDAGEAIDIVLFVNRAKGAGVFDAIGGSAYLYKIGQSVPNAAHARYYAGVVAEKARKRRIINASTDALREAYDDVEPSMEILSRTEDRLFALRDTKTIRQARPIGEFANDALEEIDRCIRGEGTAAIPTGFIDLDNMLSGGFRPGELILVAARPSVGKSALAADFALSISKDHLAAFFSLEMTGQNLTERMMSNLGDVKGVKIRNRTLSAEDRRRLVEAGVKLHGRHCHMDDNSRLRVGDIAASVRTIQQRTGQRVELIVVDYLQFVTPDDSKATREQQVAMIARRLKSLAKDQQCPVVAVCAVNRGNEYSGKKKDCRPKLSQLRESGSLEFEADVVLLLHREDYGKTGAEAEECAGQAEVIVAKQRNGPCGTVELRWDAEKTTFQNLAPYRAEDCANYEAGFERYNQGESPDTF